MDEKQQYFELWNKAMLKLKEAMIAGDAENIEKYHQDVEDAYERYKEAADFETQMMDSKFATINTTLESVMPKLMAKNKKALRECINLIKEDKNLMAQFKFCNALKKFNCDTDAKDYINESLNLVSKDINIKTLKESNQKLAKLLVKYSIKPSNDINESDLKFAKNCDYLLSHKKNLNNLTEFTNNLKEASDYIVENRKNNKERIDILSMAEQVEKKLNSLNEAEQALVKDIMVAKTGVAESRRQNLFNKIKNECIDKINKMIDENTGSEKERLLNLKETILLKEYDKNNVVGDIAKLLEIGAVLSDSEHDKYL